MFLLRSLIPGWIGIILISLPLSGAMMEKFKITKMMMAMAISMTSGAGILSLVSKMMRRLVRMGVRRITIPWISMAMVPIALDWPRQQQTMKLGWHPFHGVVIFCRFGLPIKIKKVMALEIHYG